MMLGISELQLSLIVIGGLSVGGVWTYNRWQEYRQRKQTQAAFREPVQDVLMQTQAGSREPGPPAQADASIGQPAPVRAAAARQAFGRIEPTLHVPDEEADAVGLDPEAAETQHTAYDADQPAGADALPEEQRMEGSVSAGTPAEAASAPHDAVSGHGLDMARHGDDHAHAGTTAATDASLPGSHPEPAVTEIPLLDVVAESRPPLELADEEIDSVVHLQANELIAAPLFWDAQRKLLSRLAKRIHWSGLDENVGRWQTLHADDANSYRQLVAALQIVDRHGPVAADDLALYCDGLRQLTRHYQARAIVPVVADVVNRARALDEFCASVDWQLALNMLHPDGQALSIAAIRQIAEVVGLRPSEKGQPADGRLHGLDAHGMTAYSLSLLGGPSLLPNEAATTVLGITLSLDVPRVADGVAAFDRMLQLAQVINTRLGAVIVDEQRAALKPEMLTMIRSKIDEFQQKMIARQIPPGGRRALRLYA